MAAQFGRRLRRGATTTAVAAAAVAALSASQAPAAPHPDGASDDRTAAGATPPGDSAATGNSPVLHGPSAAGHAQQARYVRESAGDRQCRSRAYPASVLAAYKKAEQDLASTDAACRLPWQLLAAIGKVESGQARGGKVDANGTTLSPILGPVLNGQGFALIKDTDGGAYDGDATHDRAVGPMQFIPSTWATLGPGRQRRRAQGPQQHLRRGAGRRALPLRRHPRPVARHGPRPGGAELQPLHGVPAHGPLLVRVLQARHPRGPGRHGRPARDGHGQPARPRPSPSALPATTAAEPRPATTPRPPRRRHDAVRTSPATTPPTSRRRRRRRPRPPPRRPARPSEPRERGHRRPDRHGRTRTSPSASRSGRGTSSGHGSPRTSVTLRVVGEHRRPLRRRRRAPSR